MGNWSPEQHPVRYIECSCGDSSHVTRFAWWRWECDPNDTYWDELSVETQMNLQYPWYRRVWLAVKYVFGMQCRYGHWHEASFRKTEVEKLVEVCQEYIKNIEEKDSMSLRDKESWGNAPYIFNSISPGLRELLEASPDVGQRNPTSGSGVEYYSKHTGEILLIVVTEEKK